MSQLILERYKYIYFTLTGEEQLFDLLNDPAELVDLTNETNPPAELISFWRDNMIDHLSVRGKEWVENGKLQVQDSSIYFGRNHPMFLKSK